MGKALDDLQDIKGSTFAEWELEILCYKLDDQIVDLEAKLKIAMEALEDISTTTDMAGHILEESRGTDIALEALSQLDEDK